MRSLQQSKKYCCSTRRTDDRWTKEKVRGSMLPAAFPPEARPVFVAFWLDTCAGCVFCRAELDRLRKTRSSRGSVGRSASRKTRRWADPLIRRAARAKHPLFLCRIVTRPPAPLAVSRRAARRLEVRVVAADDVAELCGGGGRGLGGGGGWKERVGEVGAFEGVDGRFEGNLRRRKGRVGRVSTALSEVAHVEPIV